MKKLRWGSTGCLICALAACGSGTGATGADAGPTDVGDSQIAPLDAQDADGTDAAATDVLAPEVMGTDAAATDVQEDAPGDAADSADAFQPTNCLGGNTAACTASQICWSEPCQDCGVMPASYCLPALTGGGCYDYSQCNGGDCYHADPMNGVAGWCLPVIATAGQCWPGASELIPDCYTASTCDGSVVCAPNADCVMADKPGTCHPAGEQKGSVILWERNGGTVAPGKLVTVTWINNTSASIFLPGCATYSIQTSPDGSTWTDIGPKVVCLTEGVAVQVPAGAYYDTQGWSAPTGSATNYRFHGSYSTGCTPGQPLSQANCASSSTVDSSSFFVGYVP